MLTSRETRSTSRLSENTSLFLTISRSVCLAVLLLRSPIFWGSDEDVFAAVYAKSTAS